MSSDLGDAQQPSNASEKLQVSSLGNANENKCLAVAFPVPKSSQCYQPSNFDKKTMANIRLRTVRHHLNRLSSQGKEAQDLVSLTSEEILDIYEDDDTRRRLILTEWPCDPNGKTQIDGEGKHATPENTPWGETILHFYNVVPYPGYMAFRSSSQLAAAVKTENDIRLAKNELKIAQDEDIPRRLPPFDVAKLILESEQNIRDGHIGHTLTSDSSWWTNYQPTRSPSFDLTRFPSPWPIRPFSYVPPRLDKRLPLMLLPETIYVQATRYVLSARSSPPFTGEIFKYKLALSEEGKKKLQAELEHYNRIVKQQGLKGDNGNESSTSSTTPSSLVDILPYSPIERPKEARLYITPQVSAGSGNHSFVFRGDLDLPRDVLIPKPLCQKCIDDGIGCEITEQDEKDDLPKAEQWKTPDEEMTCEKSISEGSQPIVAQNTTNSNSTDFAMATLPEDNADQAKKELNDIGGCRPVEPDVEHQDPSRRRSCPHTQDSDDLADSAQHPPIARVCLAVKLSFKDDYHLARETVNYQKFPDYFFEHWSGYHVVRPLDCHPTPIGAIVPQFYGYYEPVQDDDKGYLSPLLLLEYCGSTIDSDMLSVDDRTECASLAFRFKDAGWNHGSIASRNYLHQPGPLWKHPSERGSRFKRSGYDSAYSFRIIDFGRSKEQDPEGNCKCHEIDLAEIEKLFRYNDC